ncbi:dienelactone hydrolase family protein [Asanoa siamensis]|uniref:Carboxymethylenebutenolidase n=1 Tax=Asanoa siamensis TaxID=926357 RepID=A0ABQ4D2Y5_9ACTN|nr:dienelactone hydrolase family protein [Asanoa siamensis]GIF77648.1 putative carboxymethylenebutenolidase [Asanoa siamensis]
MCYGDDARPPQPPNPGPVGSHGPVVLESGDGTSFGGYFAHPAAGPSARGIVIFPDVRGLHVFYQEFARSFAAAGLSALAFDYFGRTTDLGSSRGEDFSYREHVDQLDFDSVRADGSTAAAWLRANGSETLFTVGFCFGGAMSWRQAAAGDDLRGSIGFYGIPSRVANVTDQIASPLQILAAGQDFTPVAEVEQFADRVRGHGVDVRMTVYPDAGHSFFDRNFGQHQADVEDAWRQMLSFIDDKA